jgi:hypothetical protein
MISCALCGMGGVFAYAHLNGTNKDICIPCLGIASEMYKVYVNNVINKAKHYPPERREME